MKKRYFTLVELLVVIAIIGILAGMILGGVALARASARGAECKNNQKQMMEIEIQAMNGNKNFLVSGNDFKDSAGDDAAWTRYLYGDGGDSGAMKGKTAFISDMKNLRCPSLKYDDDGQTLGAMSSNDRETALKAAYGMVYRASKESNAKFAGFDFRGTKFLKYGSGSNAYNVSPNQLVLGGCASKDAPYDQAESLLYTGSAWDGKLVKIHSDKCNVFFLDGHTEELTKSELEKKYLPSASANEPVKFPSGDTAGWIDPDK